MSRPIAVTTTVSTKGQVILPKAIRDRRGWRAGVRLVVKETPEGVLLTQEPVFPPTRIDDVVGMLKYDGPPISVEDMNVGVADYLRRKHARD